MRRLTDGERDILHQLEQDAATDAAPAWSDLSPAERAEIERAYWAALDEALWLAHQPTDEDDLCV
jgi:acyl-CoA reductase-like NAD-dependent aldehyde dehydrogenase